MPIEFETRGETTPLPRRSVNIIFKLDQEEDARALKQVEEIVERHRTFTGTACKALVIAGLEQYDRERKEQNESAV